MLGLDLSEFQIKFFDVILQLEMISHPSQEPFPGLTFKCGILFSSMASTLKTTIKILFSFTSMQRADKAAMLLFKCGQGRLSVFQNEHTFIATKRIGSHIR